MLCPTRPFDGVRHLRFFLTTDPHLIGEDETAESIFTTQVKRIETSDAEHLMFLVKPHITERQAELAMKTHYIVVDVLTDTKGIIETLLLTRPQIAL